jgi:hypothetical protein
MSGLGSWWHQPVVKWCHGVTDPHQNQKKRLAIISETRTRQWIILIDFIADEKSDIPQKK